MEKRSYNSKNNRNTNYERNQKSFFARHKIITAILVLFVITSIGGLLGDGKSNAKTDARLKSYNPSDIFTLNDGTYKVGEDLEAGEYLLLADGMAYFEVASDSKGGLESIISNDNFANSRYVTIKEGTYLKLQRCTLMKPEEVSLDMSKEETLLDGMYKVGKDLDPGEYKVEALGSDSYTEISNDSLGGLGSIAANDIFSGQKYVTVSEGQYLKLSNKCKLLLNE